MSPSEFIAQWSKTELTERSASQQHFLDLCELMAHPKPAEVDPKGEWFTFEKGVDKHGGGEGWADVWKRGHFGWEYKGKHKDLDAAYNQLLKYRESLENPPLLVVCDMERIIVRTNFTATPTQKHEIPLTELGDPRNLEILRAVFHEPDKLKPGVTREAITTEAARRLGDIAQSLRSRGLDAHDVARFLDRVVFCLFAEDVGLLSKDLFSRVVENTRKDPARFARQLSALFDAMAHGGDFGAETIRHFNGNLFNTRRAESPSPPSSATTNEGRDGDTALLLTTDEIESIRDAAKLEWSAVDASIFGTLFERGLDPAKRSQLGAHYTSRADIETLVEPVVMQPLRREWEEVKQKAESLLSQETQDAGRKTQDVRRKTRIRNEVDSLLKNFLNRLANVKVLDPACGSGNFLYVTLQKLKDLEKEVVDYALSRDFSAYLPQVGPWQLYGIEVNPYAFDLAQMTVWIGYLQWLREHGYLITDDPVLRPMEGNFRCMDAILDGRTESRAVSPSPPNDVTDDVGRDGDSALRNAPREPDWQPVDFIVGNPPFLGGSRIWEQLGREYQQKLWRVYQGRVPGFADLCCYWFEKARRHIEEGKCRRAGLLATQAIRGGANREVLKRIKETGDIFFAVSDRDWILDGANVHVSMVGFDDGAETNRVLDSKPVPVIHANLSAAANVTEAQRLEGNFNLSFIGTKKAGDFNIPDAQALKWLRLPNPHGKPNSDVLKPWLNGSAIVKRPDAQWIVDCGTDMTHDEFTFYEEPYRHVLTHVKPERDKNNRPLYREKWWLHAETRPGMRQALAALPRYLATPRVSKHRVFVWVETIVLPDDGVFVFARADDYFFGVLHSWLHEVWARAQGTQVRERESGFRYTPTTCFETFPFPDLTPEQADAIAEAARELDRLRNNWLNPPQWTREEVLEFPGSIVGPWARYITPPPTPPTRGGEKESNSVPLARGGVGGGGNEVGTVRYPRLVPKDADCAAQLSKRTLTNLYNQRPTWLDLAHRKLDEAVYAAYGWDAGMSDEEILERLLELNLEHHAI